MSTNISCLKYFGGKSSFYKKISHIIPKHKKRLSPFFGSGGIELNILPTDETGFNVSEIYNDIDKDLINFYQVIQDPYLFENLARLCNLSPFSEEEFESSKRHFQLPVGTFGLNVERAWRFFIRNRLSVGGNGKQFAVSTNRLRRGINENVSAYLSAIDGLAGLHNRLRLVEFRNMDFSDFIQIYDTEDAFFIIDPPYLPETRSGGGYAFELTEQDHMKLLNLCENMKAKFLLNGYDSKMYNTFAGANLWTRLEIEKKASSSFGKTKTDRKEIVWTNF